MMPLDTPVYEWCYDQSAGAWVQWMATIPEFKCDPDKPFAEVGEAG
jgi:dynein heavy chain